jgi:RNA polymerase sigma-70 factor (ECF subfamily)
MSQPLQPSSSFDALVREHQAGLRAYIRALGAHDAWVDDLAQEAFLVAYRRHGEFDEAGDFGRWVRGIARNLVLNERRKSARRSRLLHEPIVDLLAADTAADAFTATAAARILQVLNDCVAQLPSRSREILQRRYMNNAAADALGALFSSSAAAIRQTLMRSRAALRRCVDVKLGEGWL